MLINDFYTCEDIAAVGQELTCRLVFNAGHRIFEGHFPAEPVVPGVCMMEIVKELLQEQVGERLMLRTAGNAKFLQIVGPATQPEVQLTWSASEGRYTAKAAFKQGAAFFFKFDAEYSVVTPA